MVQSVRGLDRFGVPMTRWLVEESSSPGRRRLERARLEVGYATMRHFESFRTFWSLDNR